jgi:hypothetical protein
MDWRENQPLSRLRTLLGPKPTHPWGALIPQLLLWSFRRFCVEKLLYSLDQPLSEQIWDDHLELVNRYCPHGLESACGTWLTDENLELVHSPLEEYNAFFIDLLKLIDTALETDSEDDQNAVSEFLDESIRVALKEWATEGPMEKFFIFPMDEAQDDIFTAEQMLGLIDHLIEYSRERANTILGVPQETPVEQLPVPEPQAPPEAEAEPPHPIEPPPQLTTTVAEAIRRRRTTFRAHGHRANRNTTLRRTRVRAKTRKNHIDPQ